MRQHPQFPKEEEPRFIWCLAALEQLGDDKTRSFLADLLGPQHGQDDGMTEEQRKKMLAQEHRERIMKEFQTKQQS
jgi:hypothetical protein